MLNSDRPPFVVVDEPRSWRTAGLADALLALEPGATIVRVRGDLAAVRAALEQTGPAVLITGPGADVDALADLDLIAVVGIGTVPDARTAARARPLLLVDLARDERPQRDILAAATDLSAAKTVVWNGMRAGGTDAERIAREIVVFADEVSGRRAALRPADGPLGVERTATLADGTVLAYTEYGEGDRVILTAQMEFPAQPNYPSLLAAEPVGARVLAIVLRGFRPSSLATEDLGLGWLDRWSDDMVELADLLGIDRFAYTGGSHGGGVGWYLAQQHPERLTAYIGVVSGPHDRERTTRSSGVRAAINASWPDRAAIRTLMEEGVFGPDLHADEPERSARRARLIEESVEGYGRMDPAEAAINQGKPWPDATTDEQLAEVLRGIRVPTLLLSGMRDVIITPGAAFRSSSSVPFAKSVLWQDEGHMTWEEEPALLAEEVGSFLDELDGARS